MTLVLDTGALLAYERGDRTVQAHLERASRTGTGVLTTTGVVAQAWRNGSRQARMARLLRGVAEVELGPQQARRVGALLGASGGCDVIDGSIVDTATDGDEILTSDPDDLEALATASGKTLLITRV
jgi:hypothetical protein